MGLRGDSRSGYASAASCIGLSSGGRTAVPVHRGARSLTRRVGFGPGGALHIPCTLHVALTRRSDCPWGGMDRPERP